MPDKKFTGLFKFRDTGLAAIHVRTSVYSVLSLNSHKSSIRHEPQRGLRAMQV